MAEIRTPSEGGPLPSSEGGSQALVFEQPRGSPTLGEAQQAELRAGVQDLPAAAGIGLVSWNWIGLHQFVRERFGVSLSRSGCLNYLYRLGFVLEGPKKRLLKADRRKRECFAVECAALTAEPPLSGDKIFFVDEASFRADAELRASRC